MNPRIRDKAPLPCLERPAISFGCAIGVAQGGPERRPLQPQLRAGMVVLQTRWRAVQHIRSGR